ncbi:MAG: WGR domain-containing protein [Candidatus Competibacter sp.]|nr:WGR domain-containing protein [Candidatus Competibacter sp.]
MLKTLESSIRLRWEKSSRYYEVRLGQDLWGQWIITRTWGRIGTALGRQSDLLCLSYQNGLQQVEAAKQRRRQRGYALVREESERKEQEAQYDMI